MKKLGILLVVLSMCLPAYGYVLVYKVTMSGTGANADPNGWVLGTGSKTGYLVLDVDDSDPNILNDVEYIAYYTVRSGRITSKIYDIYFTDGDFSQSILQGRPPRGKNITVLNVGLWNESSTVQLTGLLLGNTANTDIGTLDPNDKKTKVNVATNPKGICRYVSSADLTDPNVALDAQGGGTLITTLDSKWTKIANDPDSTKGFGGDSSSFLDPTSGPPDNPDSPRGLLNWLISTGYTPPIL